MQQRMMPPARQKLVWSYVSLVIGQEPQLRNEITAALLLNVGPLIIEDNCNCPSCQALLYACTALERKADGLIQTEEKPT